MKEKFEKSASEISKLKNQIETERQVAEQAREQSEKTASQAKTASDEQKSLYATIAELKDKIHVLELKAVQTESQKSKITEYQTG